MPFHRRFHRHLKKFLGLPFKEKSTYLLKKVESKTKFFYKLFQDIMPPSSEDILSLALTKSHRQLVRNYLPPQVYPGQLTLFRVKEEFVELYYYYDSQLGWGGFAAEGLETHDVPGTHETMLTEPHIQVLSEKLAACIERVSAARLK